MGFQVYLWHILHLIVCSTVGSKTPTKKGKKGKRTQENISICNIKLPYQEVRTRPLASSGFIAISDLNHLYPVVFKIETKLRNSHLLTWFTLNTTFRGNFLLTIIAALIWFSLFVRHSSKHFTSITYLILNTPCKGNTNFILIFLLRILRHRD